MLPTAMFILGAYLLGAVPFGFLIGRARGVDIRTQGSKNIGATNVGRVLGKPWGTLCLTLDILKGLAPTLLYGLLLMPAAADSVDWLLWLAVAVAAVLGHLFPAYLGFRGGKGVATTIGVALGLFPYFTVAILVAVAAYFALRLTTGLVSVGSLSLAVVFPIAVYSYAVVIRDEALADVWPLTAVAALLSVLIIVRHRANIQRLLAGKELRAAATAEQPESNAG